MPAPGTKQRTVMQRALSRWQVTALVINGVIGTGIFQNSSLALAVAGPGGALVGVAVVGIIAIAVMECVGELIVLFPTSNAMVEYVHTFVDEDLAVIVGIGYWLMHTIMHASLITSTLNLTGYWSVSSSLRVLLASIIYLLIFGLHTMRIRHYGNIQLLWGYIKMLLILGLFVLLIISSTKPVGGRSAYDLLSDGIQWNQTMVNSKFAGISTAISLATYSYAGLEAVSTTSFETYEPGADLKLPSRSMSWLVTLWYLVLTLLYGLTVDWNDDRLPRNTHGLLGGVVPYLWSANAHSVQNLAAPVIATKNLGVASDMIVGFFMWSAATCASTSLYTSSRSLFGMARTLDKKVQWLPYRLLAWFGVVERGSGAPWRAVLLSAVAFIWVPFVAVSTDNTRVLIPEVLTSIAVVTCVLVWASQCLAFIRFDSLRRKFDQELTGEKYAKFKAKHMLLAELQPLVAYIGLIGCLMLLILFNSAILWDGQDLIFKVVTAYLGPIAFTLTWVGVKSWRLCSSGRQHHLYVHINDSSGFKKRLLKLSNQVFPTDHAPRVESIENPQTLSNSYPATVRPQDAHIAVRDYAHGDKATKDRDQIMSGSRKDSPRRVRFRDRDIEHTAPLIEQLGDFRVITNSVIRGQESFGTTEYSTDWSDTTPSEVRSGVHKEAQHSKRPERMLNESETSDQAC